MGTPWSSRDSSSVVSPAAAAARSRAPRSASSRGTRSRLEEVKALTATGTFSMCSCRLSAATTISETTVASLLSTPPVGDAGWLVTGAAAACSLAAGGGAAGGGASGAGRARGIAAGAGGAGSSTGGDASRGARRGGAGGADVRGGADFSGAAGFAGGATIGVPLVVDWACGRSGVGRSIWVASNRARPATLAATSQLPRRQTEGRRGSGEACAGAPATAASTRARRAARAVSSLIAASALA